MLRYQTTQPAILGAIPGIVRYIQRGSACSLSRWSSALCAYKTYTLLPYRFFPLLHGDHRASSRRTLHSPAQLLGRFFLPTAGLQLIKLLVPSSPYDKKVILGLDFLFVGLTQIINMAKIFGVTPGELLLQGKDKLSVAEGKGKDNSKTATKQAQLKTKSSIKASASKTDKSATSKKKLGRPRKSSKE